MHRIASHRIASHRAAAACAALAIHGLAGRVCVHNMNMIDGVLSNTGLLFLTSQCWEDELLVLVRAKIEAELPVGEYRRVPVGTVVPHAAAAWSLPAASARRGPRGSLTGWRWPASGGQ